MKPVFGQIVRKKGQSYFSLGEVVTNNPQLILDNVNYIGKKNFVIHIKFGAGITRNVVLLVKLTDRQLPGYLTKTDLDTYQSAVENGDFLLLNTDSEDLNGFQLVEELEIEDPGDEQIANLASIRENTIQFVERYLKNLQTKIDKLSQRKANHYFSSKTHYEQVKDFLLSVSQLMDLRMKINQVRQDEWRLKLKLGGQ
ncbi:hypothetical protein [Lentilactobacillus hilgardii]|uniref:Uncharacterized protein n=1 Tax=Lentilactobacillus hilgardii (strain ATCC 8290 / DSM 20176 / CCUG 30140 / JCM 1155 / KCTC 3500 / NBRC 15886 / NCIMB 8040 / NRRL B-1843 / 9) TaxID=1423757 RepID=C0XH27_LENH9|nr:hypothetical protein [Lentilactobacillus hilgardii]EEI19381.1 hypothetical protein HMPREF0497_1726 [Lentilactobacillus buchneri ATCC 11577]EEI25342.1 hypothetical protein HMPREF0519_0538 [Lentilactobacillus hilgardii DSM 20176 = ATCC 8290]KRK53907.1 hypothetical protein FD42_GL001485 [Lentilactobacillus hilgardii DSM 20176 = ATCC 8290]MCP9332549.1 hypothetical protein [Lentilactobacillus hilgardii]MCP9349156.1 hypothetical protein [Lentilactobacillus hilgardii]